MNRRNFLKTAGLATAYSFTRGFALGGFSATKDTALAVSAGRPNVLLICTDDHAQWAVGAYGNKEIHTPNMDRLADEGMRFTQCFTKPVCSPSRAMMLTGLYSHRVGIPDYIPYGNPVHVDNGLPYDIATIASVLKSVGYTSGLVGKWHLGYGEKYYPERFGFDIAEGYRWVGPGKEYDSPALVPCVVNGEEVSGFCRDQRHTDILTDRAINFVRENRSKPFFLFFNTYVPHQSSWGTAPEEDLAHYKDRPLTVPDVSRFPEVRMDEAGLRRLMATYYGHITCADRNVGRLLAALDELKLSDNTIIIFMGDNGMNLGHHGLIGKGNASILGLKPRLYRPNMFDHSILVPFLIRWPGVVKGGTTSDALVSTIDILPTLAEIAGIEAPAGVDGRSLLALLKGEPNVIWRDAYCDTYDMIYLGNDGEKTYMCMIRTDDWKLVLYQDENGRPLDGGSRHELFHLEADPDELTNLYGKLYVQNIQHNLEAHLLDWMRKTGVTK